MRIPNCESCIEYGRYLLTQEEVNKENHFCICQMSEENQKEFMKDFPMIGNTSLKPSHKLRDIYIGYNT